MAPTRIYVKPLLALIAAVPVHGLSHITGGGLLDNIPRVLPDGLEVVLERSAWPREPVFDWLQAPRAASPTQEMYRVFNCGIGMTVQVAAGRCRARDRAAARRRPGRRSSSARYARGARGVVIA